MTNLMNLPVKALEHFRGEFPQYESKLASGMDIRAQVREPVVLKPLSRGLIPTGLIFEIPEGFEIQVRPRSGLAFKQGLTVLNSPGTIDADYRGELKILVINLGHEDITISDQDRIAQLVIAPVIQARVTRVEAVNETHRGAGGFGSTGVS